MRIQYALAVRVLSYHVCMYMYMYHTHVYCTIHMCVLHHTHVYMYHTHVYCTIHTCTVCSCLLVLLVLCEVIVSPYRMERSQDGETSPWQPGSCHDTAMNGMHVLEYMWPSD